LIQFITLEFTEIESVIPTVDVEVCPEKCPSTWNEKDLLVSVLPLRTNVLKEFITLLVTAHLRCIMSNLILFSGILFGSIPK
jgi:hypothetical protein